MLQQIFLGFTGLCSGFIIAGGLTGLMIGLSIIPRYAGITHTADHMMLYEDITFWGTELGNLFFLFHWDIRFGTPFLILYGLFSGIFLGGWIMALAEMADIFPIFARTLWSGSLLPGIRKFWKSVLDAALSQGYLLKRRKALPVTICPKCEAP